MFRDLSLKELFDDFFLNTRVSLRAMKTLFLLALFTRTDDFLQLLAYFYEYIWRFYLTIRVSRRAIHKAKFDRITVSLVNSVREICCVRDNESSSLRIDKKIALKTSSSQIDWFSCWKCAIVTNWSSCFFLLADDESECEVYIVRHNENQILCHESCLNT